MKVVRRLFVAVFALFFFLIVCVPTAADLLRFQDVGSGTDTFDAVEWVYQKQVDFGTTETTFSPDRPVSLAELSGFLYRYAYLPAPKYTCGEALNAGDPSQWRYAAMHWSADCGLIPAENSPDYPTRTLSRGQAVEILFRYANNWEHRPMEVEGDPLAAYPDAPAEAFSREAWSWALSRGLLDSGETLRPDSPMTRGDVAVLLYRYRRYIEPNAQPLQCQIRYGIEPRGWQRLLIETGEQALGAEWVDGAYELGPDGIPAVIDCSGYVNWMFTSSGLHPYDDLECKPLWNSDVFVRLDARGYNETGLEFLTRVKSALKLGDLLVIHEKPGSGYHIMVYLGASRDGSYLLHSVAKHGVIYACYKDADYYMKHLYGVLRFEP